MSVLVTGGNGLVGIHTALLITMQGEEVVSFSRRGMPELAKQLFPRGKLHDEQGDIRDLKALQRVVKDHRVCEIVHTAAMTGDTAGDVDPATMVEINVLGTANVLEVARLNKCNRVVYVSSSAVYGPPKDDTPVNEDAVNPQRIYSETKLMGEVIGNRFHATYGLDFVTARVTSVYGPFSAERTSGSMAGHELIKLFCKAALEGRPLTIPAGGNYSRGYTYVMDTAEGLRLLLNARSLAHRVYNIALGQSYTVTEVAETVASLVPDARIDRGAIEPEKAGRKGTGRASLDISRARDDVGFNPQYDLKKGIQAYMKWLKAQPG